MRKTYYIWYLTSLLYYLLGLTKGITTFLIIDGQQRLTTVSLLLLAMYHLLQKKIAVSQDRQLPDKILKKYLIDEYEPEEKRIKLKPIKNDQKAFGFLFERDEEHIPDSNLTINYQYFHERIQRGGN